MKRRISLLISIYLLFTLIFALQKPIFMLYYQQLFERVSLLEWFQVIINGLPLDFSFAGYLTIIPGLLLITSVWMTSQKLLKTIFKCYYLIISLFISIIFVADLGLYEYWGFRLDSTPLFYFLTSPKDALASMTIWMAILGFITLIGYTAIIYNLLYRFTAVFINRFKFPFHRINQSLIILLLTGLLFIPIRGGFTVSTMNIGKVYFSENQRLNHAAINPCFSFTDSFMRQSNFDKQYRFLDKDEADTIFSQLTETTTSTDTEKLLTNNRPNIIMIIMESFSSYLLETLGGEPGIAPQVNKLADEGVLFTNMYANSFRTDRGIVSILSGYPAQPTTSIMKYARKTQSLPSIPKTLKEEGYHLYYYYGGDADFTNMRSYLVSMGIDNIVCDKDFPASQRLSKWGAHDEVVFNKLWDNLKEDEIASPFFIAFQTSSSHEPFEVPYDKLEDKKLNAFAYTDECIGQFIDELKASSYWDNTLVLLVPDHLGVYPYDLNNQSSERYKIPMIMTGGVVAEPKRIDTIGSQIDIAATLLGQLDIVYDDFTFSKNMLNPDAPHFAFFTMPNFLGWVSNDGEVVFDCESNTVVKQEGSNIDENLKKGQTYLQKLYDDIAKR